GYGHTAMMRQFAGLNDEMRQKFRNAVFSVTSQKVRETLDKYFSADTKKEAVAVYASREKLEQANKLLGKRLIIENLIEN
ncbi:MAG: hypothetical protein WBK44_09735, partial [Smithellaceae bacterium]